MKKIKSVFILVAIILASATVSAQEKSETPKEKSGTYIHVSGQAGWVLKTKQDKSFGIGGTVGLMFQDNLLSQKNYFTLSAKGFNSPFGDGKFITSILNKKTDAFNYYELLAGYRFTTNSIENGLFAEPRIGFGKGYTYQAFVFSPVIGFAFNKFELGVFSDFGFSQDANVLTGEKGYTTLGLSVGYNIGL